MKLINPNQRCGRSLTRIFFLVSLSGLEPAVAGLSLVKDVNEQINPAGSAPAEFVELNGIAYFTADDGVHGRELWKSDGTAEGTVLVREIRPYNASPNPANLVSANGLVFFTADDGVHGLELWKSDGSEAGTAMIKDILPGTASGLSTSPFVTEMNGLVFFAANDGSHGTELWRSDGTEAGTVMVKDGDSADVYPQNLIAAGGTLFFVGFDSTKGYELWKSDGSEAGTVPVKDIRPGNGSSSPAGFTGINTTLFFTANDGVNGTELWMTDSTEAGTVMIKDITSGIAGSNLSNLANVNGTLFFSVFAGSTALWKSDGTEEGTEMVEGIPNSGRFTDVNGDLYFVDGFGDVLYRHDGGGGGLDLVYDNTLCRRFGGHAWMVPFGFNGANFFFSECQLRGLVITDGTPAGTANVKTFTPARNQPPVNVDGTLFFSGEDGVHGFELWTSDGTPDGTVMVKDIRAATSNSTPIGLTDVNGTLYFAANDGLTGNELWRSDGTGEGTYLLKEISPGLFSHGNPSALANLDGALLFAASDGTSWNAGNTGTELWRSDGTEAGTELVKDIYEGHLPNNIPHNSNPASLLAWNHRVYFAASDALHGNELWASNGSGEGTVLVKDIHPTGSSVPTDFIISNEQLFFSANDGTNGVELWRSDGTEGGTMMVSDLNPGPAASNPADLTDVNGVLFFTANDGTNGIELWKCDGAGTGTMMVRDLWTGSLASNPTNLFNFSGTLFFAATVPGSGTELWKSDGTSEGTVMVKEIYPGGSSSSPRRFTALDGVLYFWANDNTGGPELWRSDGTTEGTMRVKDIYPGSSGSSPERLVAFNGRLFFTASDGIHGFELWTSDGTEEGTFLVADLFEGPLSSSPRNFEVSGGTLFFTADRPDVGAELFALFRDDFGDAPAPYPTLHADNGARHLIPTGGATLYLGNVAPDGGLDGHPDATATGDDTDDDADEEGIGLPPYLNSAQTQSAAVVVTGEGGVLNAWVDWNADGDWDDEGEQIFTDLAAPEGTNDLDFTVPTLTVSGASFARFRLSTAAGLSPGGAAPDGEVEDYLVTLNLPPTVAGTAANNVGQEGAFQTSYSFTVTYADDHGLHVSSFDGNDVTVSGPGGALAIVGASEPSGVDGSPKTVTYTVTPPGGSWIDADNGSYTIALAGGEVVDVGGLFVAADPAAASFTVTMDTTPPETTIADQPNDPSNQASATFGLSGDDGLGTGVGAFEYSLDGGAFVLATNPQTLDGLGEGTHTFQARAIDLVGNVETTPASYTWTVDTIPPDTALFDRPMDPSDLASAGFSFDGDDGDGTGVAGFEASLDGGPFAPAASPLMLSDLSEGEHTFQVRAIDRAGNIDQSVAAYNWIVDTIPPDTVLTDGPSELTARTTATFTFSGDDGSGTGIAGFETNLDGAGFVAAGSPQTVSGLEDGVHTYQVRAIDAAGNADPSPAGFTWTVNAIPSPAFATTGLLLLEDGTLRIQWESAGPAFVYTVEESDSLQDDWHPCDAAEPWPIAATEFETSFVGPRKFFRIRAEPVD